MNFFKKYRLNDGNIYWHKLYFDFMPKWSTDHCPPLGAYNWAWYFYNPHKYIAHLWDEVKWFVQRGTRGYSDRDVWGWYDHMARINVAALRQLATNKIGHPMGMTVKGWHSRLLKMINGFQTIIDNMEDTVSYKRLSRKKHRVLLRKRQTRVRAGLRLYCEHFESLWD